MNSLKCIRLFWVGITSVLLSGCAAFQTSTTQNLPLVTSDAPPPEKAMIVVDGSSSWAGMFKLYAVKLYDNKVFVGKVGPHGKMAWLRDPGPMDISIQGVIGRRTTAEAGKTYHYKIDGTGLIYSVMGPGTAFNYANQQQSSGDPGNTSDDILKKARDQYQQEQLQRTIQDAGRFRQQYDNSMKR